MLFYILFIEFYYNIDVVHFLLQVIFIVDIFINQFGLGRLASANEFIMAWVKYQWFVVRCDMIGGGRGEQSLTTRRGVLPAGRWQPQVHTFLHLREKELGFSGLADLKSEKWKINKKRISKKNTTCEFFFFFPTKSCKNKYLQVYFINNLIKRSVAWNLRCFSLQIHFQTKNLIKIIRKNARENLATEVLLPFGFSLQYLPVCLALSVYVCLFYSS